MTQNTGALIGHPAAFEKFLGAVRHITAETEAVHKTFLGYKKLVEWGSYAEELA